MIRTQIQLPDNLYRRLRRLADLQEISLAEVIRRAGERELSEHPELEELDQAWHLPAPRALGIRKEISVEDWRLLANDIGPEDSKGR